VLALREIVADVGADRGILLSEAGFQSGAIEAATLTNVKVTSLAEASISATNDIYSMRLRDLFNRLEDSSDRYWDIDKDQRIEHGLRPDVGEWGYSGNRAIELARELLSRAFRDRYPISLGKLAELVEPNLPAQFHSAEEVFAAVKRLVDELEQRLNKYESTHRKT
jgi:restriction system protein